MANLKHESYRMVKTTEDDEAVVDGKKRKKKIPRALYGYFFVFISAFSLCLSATLNKLASRIAPIDQLIIRYTIQLIMSYSVCKYKKLNCFAEKGQRRLLVVRALIGVTISFVTLFAIRLIHISDYIKIINTSVIITALVSRLVLKEKLTPVHIFALMLTICGFVCIFRPAFLVVLFTGQSHLSTNSSLNYTFTDTEAVVNDSETYLETYLSDYLPQKQRSIIGILLSLFVAIAYALSNVFMKMLATNKVHYALVSIYPAYFCLPVAIVTSAILILTGFSYTDYDMELLKHLFYTFVGGTFGAQAILTLSLSFEYEDASRIAIVRTVDILFSFLLQYLILDVIIDELGAIGASFILTSTICAIFFKLMETKLKRKSPCFNVFYHKF